MITSPSYPTYKQTTDVCTTKITVPAGKTINVWMNDVAILKRDAVERFLLI